MFQPSLTTGRSLLMDEVGMCPKEQEENLSIKVGMSWPVAGKHRLTEMGWERR